MHVGPTDTDIFFYDQAARVIAQDRGKGPVFVFVYLAAIHFPWDYHYRPDLLPNWVNPGNPFEIDEYLRRQEMSARDYAQFKERLGREFPDQQFLLVRFGDHQPLFAKRFIDPTLDQAEVAARILRRDPRYFTYLADAEKRGVELDMVLGDARLKMNHAPAKAYDLIFLDAFSSDSVPVHLVQFLKPITDNDRNNNEITIVNGKRDTLYVLRELGRANLKMTKKDLDSYERRP